MSVRVLMFQQLLAKKLITINKLPENGYSCLPKELWDRQGANIASSRKEMYSEKLFLSLKKGILGRDQRFSAVVLVQIDVSNVDMWKM